MFQAAGAARAKALWLEVQKAKGILEWKVFGPDHAGC